LIWSEVKQLWDVGLEEYANDMWNVIDFVTNSLYVATVALRVVAYHQVRHTHWTHPSTYKEGETTARAHPNILLKLKTSTSIWMSLTISTGMLKLVLSLN
jgi:hypothetical protein